MNERPRGAHSLPNAILNGTRLGREDLIHTHVHLTSKLRSLPRIPLILGRIFGRSKARVKQLKSRAAGIACLSAAIRRTFRSFTA